MTSRSLFFKRMKQDLEQRIWFPVIFFILLFVTMDLSLVSRLDNWSGRIDFTERLTRYVEESFFVVNSGFSVLTIIVAVISAISGYAYIHSSKKLDVYHSVPIKRESLFIQQYCYGIFYYLLPLLLHVLLCYGIVIVNGVSPDIFGQAVLFVFEQLLIYLSCYATTIVAVCLTGNVVISVLGTGVLLFYSYVLEFLKDELMVKFFETYYGPGSDSVIWAFSPIHLMINMINEGEDAGYIGFYVKLILMTAVYTVLAVFLYRKRPTEAAGKSLTYPVTEPVIKTMVVFPSSIVAGYCIASIVSNVNDFGWFVFGCIFGFVIVCPLMEIIYRKDVKAVFRRPLQIVFNGALVLGVVLIMYFDVFGYDTYVPAENKVESYAIAMPKLIHINSDRSSTAYCLKNMKITDNSSVRKLLEHGAELTRPARTDGVEIEPGDYEYTDLVVRYNLKNGKTVYRSYVINTGDEQVLQWVSDMYNDMAYKQGSYPILTEQDTEDYVGVLLDYAYYSEDIQLSSDRMSKLIETYQYELGQMTFAELMSEYPVAQLSFAIGYEDGEEYTYPMVEEIYIGATVYSDGTTFEYNRSESGYKIYPSCKQTIALLEEYGAKFVNEIPVEDIVSIRIEDYTREVMDNDGYYTKVVELEYKLEDDEQAKIAEVFSAIKPNQLVNVLFDTNRREENIDVRVTYEYDNKEFGKNCSFLKGRIPASVLADLEAAAKELN